jgi:hypothetical protein
MGRIDQTDKGGILQDDILWVIRLHDTNGIGGIDSEGMFNLELVRWLLMSRET